MDSAAEWIDPRELVLWEKNPRRNSRAVAAVAASIERYGFGAPIVARRADRRVIAGHVRTVAAIRLGLERVPVRLIELTPLEADALALVDNKTHEIAEWDDDILRDVLGAIGAADLAGFAPGEIDALLDPLPVAVLGGDGDNPASTSPWGRIRAGDPNDVVCIMGDIEFFLGRDRIERLVLVCDAQITREDSRRVILRRLLEDWIDGLCATD